MEDFSYIRVPRYNHDNNNGWRQDSLKDAKSDGNNLRKERLACPQGFPFMYAWTTEERIMSVEEFSRYITNQIMKHCQKQNRSSKYL